MRTTLGLLRDGDLDAAALFLGECRGCGRGEQEAHEWLRALLDGPEVAVVVARERRRIVGLAVASSTGWSVRGSAQCCKLWVDGFHAGLEPRLREALELVLWAERFQRQAA